VDKLFIHRQASADLHTWIACPCCEVAALGGIVAEACEEAAQHRKVQVGLKSLDNLCAC